MKVKNVTEATKSYSGYMPSIRVTGDRVTMESEDYDNDSPCYFNKKRRAFADEITEKEYIAAKMAKEV